MEMPFKLLIATVAVAAILYIIFLLYPLFTPAVNPIKEIENSLEEAEIDLGQYNSNELLFGGEQSILAKNFENRTRLVRFQCNEPGICCEKSKDCGKIFWDERAVKFPRETSLVKVSSRCKRKLDKYACTVYIGKEPAQLSLEDIPETLVLDHSAGDFEVKTKIKNTGNETVFNEIETSIEIYKKEIVNNIPTEILMYSDENVLKERIGKDSEKEIEFQIPKEEVNIDGEYIIKVKSEAVEAGYSEEEIETEIKNSPGLQCRINEARFSYPETIGSECVKKLYCNGCTFAGQCSALWEDRLAGNFESIDPEYTFQEYEMKVCQAVENGDQPLQKEDKTVYNPKGQEPSEVIFIYDDSSSTQTYIETLQEIASLSGKSLAQSGRKFIYKIIPLGSEGFGYEKWGEKLQELRLSYDWEDDVDYRHIIAMGDGDNSQDTVNAANQAYQLFNECIKVHTIHVRPDNAECPPQEFMNLCSTGYSRGADWGCAMGCMCDCGGGICRIIPSTITQTDIELAPLAKSNTAIKILEELTKKQVVCASNQKAHCQMQ